MTEAPEHLQGAPSRRLRVVMLTLDVRIDRRILQEARTLIDDGFDVYVLAGTSPGVPASSWEEGVPVERVALGRPSRIGVALRVALDRPSRISVVLQRARAVASALRPARLSAYERAYVRRALFYRPDVVHAHDLPLLRTGCAVKRATGARLVYDMHEFYPALRELSRAARSALQAAERRYVREADARVTVNPLLGEEISRTYGGVEVAVVQNAVDPPVDGGAGSLLRRECGISSDHFVLLFQGWLSPTRNLEVLIEALALVSAPVELVLLGYGDYGAALARRAAEARVAERVHLLAAKPASELLDYTASADIGLIPYVATDVNVRLCSPNKLYEYVAARLPILANAGLEFVDSVVLENGFGVVADLHSAEACARALDQFPYDDLERFRTLLAERGEPFFWRSERRRLLAVYRAILSEPSSS